MKPQKTKKKRTKFVPLDNILVNSSHSHINIPRVKACTPNQQLYIDCILNNKITFCSGVAGTGKTKISVSLAVESVLDGLFDRILITRPAVQAKGEDLGHLPGKLEDKLHPYLMPIYDELSTYLTDSEIKGWYEMNKLQIVPIAYMRGRNFHNAFVLADEAQNMTESQLIMMLTRIGRNSKMVLNGDPTQCDLPDKHSGAFKSLMYRLRNVKNLGVVTLHKEDIIREEIVTEIVNALELDN